MTDKHILIVGTGSVGKRHAENLAEMGCHISCVDPRADRLNEIRQQMAVMGSYADLHAALASGAHFDGVAVTSPPAFHVDQSVLALEHGLPVLLEKPVSPDLESAVRLRDAARSFDVPVLLGYTYRWWEPLKKLRDLLAESIVGNVLRVDFVLSAHLADWHPWERYQDFFMSSTTLGGGALLDESHWIDLMLWFFGMPEKLFARIEAVSALEIDTDDNVDMLITYSGGPRITMHLDLFGRPHEKYIRVVGEQGTVLWSMEPNRISIGRGWSQSWDHDNYQCERNDMFVGVDREYLGILAGGPVHTCSLDDGVRALHIVEAARMSHARQCAVELEKSP